MTGKKIVLGIYANNKKIGKLSFNPNDITVYKRLLAAIENLREKIKAEENIDRSSIEGEHSTVREFKAAAHTFDEIYNAREEILKAYKSAKHEINSIFGAKVFQKFTQGSYDPEFLLPLVEVVKPYFEE